MRMYWHIVKHFLGESEPVLTVGLRLAQRKWKKAREKTIILKKYPNHHPKKKIKIGPDQNGNGPYKLHLKGKYSKSVQMWVNILSYSLVLYGSGFVQF